jgi:predicted O-linked N-acetylglucosamine transferase (SPINDLY family)
MQAAQLASAATRSTSWSTCRARPWARARACWRYRPAPVQITYLGLPATTGLPFIDHVIADRFLIPEDARGFYSEQPLYMPDVYQVCDRQRVASPPPARAACGLPEAAFVFCSFNNNYKITPEMWGASSRRR